MFEHKLLDGDKYRIVTASSDYLKPEILEIREPKNSAPSDNTCRNQYAVVGEVLVERYLPPAASGERWAHEAFASPWWSVVGHPPHGGIVADFNKYIGGAYQRTLNPGENVVAYAESGEPVTFDGGAYSVTRKADAQALRGAKLGELRKLYYEAASAA